jgi:hypothetical protein
MRLETIQLDLPALAGAFSRRLHDAGVPVTAERAAAFARALTLTRPVARRRLYWVARGVFVTERSQVRAFDRVFRDVFGSVTGEAAHEAPAADEDLRTEPAPADDRPPDPGSAPPPRPPKHDAPDFGRSSPASGAGGDA